MDPVYPPPPPPSYDSLGLPGQPQTGVPQPAMPKEIDPGAIAQWMARPQGPLGCPAGLEYLCQLDQLFLQQEVEVSPGGMYGPIASSNWYRILNASGQQIYTAREETTNRGGCGLSVPGQRGFNINISDNAGHEVMRIARDPLCCSCCPCLGCEHHAVIECPVGQVVGHFRSQTGCGAIAFTISNADDEVIFTINFPCCAVSSPMHQQEFHFSSSDGSTEVAKITKHWNRIEFFYRLKKFSLSFPRDLDEKMKAVLLGTLFAIDVMYYPPLQRVRRM